MAITFREFSGYSVTTERLFTSWGWRFSSRRSTSASTNPAMSMNMFSEGMMPTILNLVAWLWP